MYAFRVSVPERDEDLATALLWEAGTAGIEVQAGASGQATLLAFFARPLDVDRVLRSIPGAHAEPTPVPDVDWVARFREGFGAFTAGGFRIVPEWDREEPAAFTLVVDPGRAFGTGTHETTRLCLAALEDLAARRPLGRVLDLGAGTGLLALAAARLGAATVVASDLDPEATSAARAHAGLNAARLHVVRADGARGLRPRRFDLVLANLMAPLLIERAAEITALLAPGGALVLSGLLVDDLKDVAPSYSTCGRPRERRDGEWAALVYDGER